MPIQERKWPTLQRLSLININNLQKIKLINTNKSIKKAKQYLKKKRSSHIYLYFIRAYEDKYGKIKNERKKKKEESKGPKKAPAKK